MSVKRETVEQRKAMPLARGVLDYFPDALLVVAEVSRIGNEQHHPGEPMHWDKSKSTDEADALMRHLLDRGTIDTDGVRHSAKVAWRALALLQRELDAEAEVELCACHVPGVPLGDEHVRRVSGPQGGPCVISHEVVSEEWGTGDGPIINVVEVTNRGEWPPDTRVNGYLTCCGQTEHALDCPQWR